MIRSWLLPSRWREDSFIRAVGLVSGGTALAQLAGLLVAPVLTRLYDPASFGIYAVYTALLSLCIVASFRYELAIPLAARNEDAVSVFAVASVALLATTMTLAVGVVVGGSSLGELVGLPAFEKVLWLLPLGALAAGAVEILTYWTLRARRFAALGKSKIGQASVQGSSQGGFGLLTPLPAGLIAGDVFGRFAGAGVLLATSWSSLWHGMREVSLRGLVQSAREFSRFPILAAPAALVNTAGLHLGPLLFATFYGARVAGHFALGQRVLGLPITLLGTAVAQVFYAETSELSRLRPEQMEKLFMRTTRRLLLLGILPALVLFISGPHIFALVFGEEWRVSGSYVRLLALMFVIQLVVSPLSQTLNILGKTHWQLGWDVARLTLSVLAIALPAEAGWTPLAAVALYGGVMAVAYLAHWMLSRRAVRGYRLAGSEEGA